MQARCSEREFKIFPGWQDSVLVFGLCHDRLGRGCTGKKANVHNRFKLAATNQSSLDPRRPMVRLPYTHGE